MAGLALRMRLGCGWGGLVGGWWEGGAVQRGVGGAGRATATARPRQLDLETRRLKHLCFSIL